MDFRTTKRSVVVSSFVLLITGSVGATEPLRLIKHKDQLKWMPFEEAVAISIDSHNSGHCGGFMDVTAFSHQLRYSSVRANSANWTTLAPLAPLQRNFEFEEMSEKGDQAPLIEPENSTLVKALLPVLSANELTSVIAQLSQFNNRYYKSTSGVEAAEWLYEKASAMGKNRTDVEIEYFIHKDFPQRSVIARIVGNHPQKKSEKVIIGGHLDSVNWKDKWIAVKDRRAPGADDDASGTSTVLEVFRVLVQSGYRPDRTLEFMFYAAEEVGLLGSQDIAQSYKAKGEKVVGVLQLDMTMFPSPKTHDIAIITDYVDPTLTQFSKKLIDTYVHTPWSTGECTYECSDHASWNEAGFPAAHIFEAPSGEMNSKLHSRGDVLDILDPSHGLAFAKFGLAFSVELGAGTL